MKKLILLFLCLIISTTIFAQQGIRFYPLPLDQALKKAEAEGKLVFVDCFTSQFDIGGQLVQELLSSEKAGEFFNSRFVCVRYDVDGDKGKELRKKLGIKSCPSYFIIRPDGIVQHMMVGISQTVEAFMERVEKGLNQQTSLYYLTQLYQTGKMDKKRMLLYKNALEDARDQENAQKIALELRQLLIEKDKLSKEFWTILEGNSKVVGSPDFNFILENLSVLKKNVGEELLNEHLCACYNRTILNYIKKQAENELLTIDELKQQIVKLDIPTKEQLIANVGLAEFVRDQNMPGLIVYMESNAEWLTGMDAWSVFRAFRSLEEKATKEDYKRVVTVLEKLRKNPQNAGLASQMELAAIHYGSLSHVGTCFEDLTFEQALEKAQKMGKKLFIHCYSSAEDSSRYMVENVFPREEIGDYLNARFICVKYDMEQKENQKLKNNLRILAYPTVVILDSKGNIGHKFIGNYQASFDFIPKVEEAFDKEKAFGIFLRKYNRGERGKEFLLQYIRILETIADKEMQGDVAGVLYASLTDDERLDEKYQFLYENSFYPHHEDARQFLLDNRKEFNSKWGVLTVDRILCGRMQDILNQVFMLRDKMTTSRELDQMRKEIISLELNNEKVLLAQVNIAKAVLDGKINRVLSACEREEKWIPVEDFPFGLSLLFEKCATPEQMKRWIEFCKQKKNEIG